MPMVKEARSRDLRSSRWKRILYRVVERLILRGSVGERFLAARTSRFDMVFTDIWREYFVRNHHEMGLRFNQLCECLDETSVNIVQVVAERYFHLAPAVRFNDVAFYRAARLFTQYEKELQAEFRIRMEKQRDKWVLPNESPELSISVFASHNGLEFIPDARQRLHGGTAIDGGAFIGDSALVIN